MIKVLGFDRLPEGCCECFAYDVETDTCKVHDLYGVVPNFDKRPSNCPLRGGEVTNEDRKYMKDLGGYTVQ